MLFPSHLFPVVVGGPGDAVILCEVHGGKEVLSKTSSRSWKLHRLLTRERLSCSSILRLLAGPVRRRLHQFSLSLPDKGNNWSSWGKNRVLRVLPPDPYSPQIVGRDPGVNRFFIYLFSFWVRDLEAKGLPSFRRAHGSILFRLGPTATLSIYICSFLLPLI